MGVVEPPQVPPGQLVIVDREYEVATLQALRLGIASFLDGGDVTAIADRLHAPAELKSRGPLRRDEKGVRIVQVEKRQGDDTEQSREGVRQIDFFVGGLEALVQSHAVEALV